MNEQHQDDIVRVAVASTSVQAHIWQNALAEEGIECQVVGDELDAGIGNISGLRPELWVHQKDAVRAREILESHVDTGGGEEEEDEGENEVTGAEE